MTKLILSVGCVMLSVGLIAICSQLTLPLAFIPLTGQTLAIGIVSTLLSLQKVYPPSSFILVWVSVAYPFLLVHKVDGMSWQEQPEAI